MRTLGQVSVLGAENRRKGMLNRSENILHRLFTREISRVRPNTHIHKVRELYENILPSHTVYEVESPDHLIRKFTNDGQYLICFSRNHQDLVVYRHRWLSYCVKGEETDRTTELPAKCKKFESHFVQLYSVSLASGNDLICKDFFLATDNNLYGLFATTSAPDPSPPAAEGAMPGVPSIEKIALYLVRLSDGHITDERIYHDDFIHLSHNMGVFLYDDLLAVLSIRYQSIRLLQIRDTGRFVDVRTVGTHCREDDELVLNSQAQEEEKYLEKQAALRKARGLPTHAEVSASKRLLTAQGNAWPLEWNLRLKQQASKVANPSRSRGMRSATSQGAMSGTAALASSSEAGGGRPDTIANGMQGADLDLQYDHYFRGLFTSMEDNSVVQAGEILSGIPGGSDIQMRINPVRHEGHRRPTHPALYENGYHSSGVETGSMFAPPEQVYGNAVAGTPMDASTSGSGGYHLGGGLFRYGRTFSSASGDSAERFTTRGSPSVRYTSTTGTSSESCSRGDSGSRWDGSVSGGGSISYGTGGAGSGSVSVQSSEINQVVDYVVTSRSRIPPSNGQQGTLVEDAYLPSSSHHLENGHRAAGNGGFAPGLPTTHEHRRTQGSAVYRPVTEETSRDRFLLSRFSNERANTGGERAAPTGSPNRPSVTQRETAPNGNMMRTAPAITPPAARLSHEAESNGAAQRNTTGTEPASTPEGGSQLLGGMKQRLLSFMFRSSCDPNLTPLEKAKMLKRFYYHFQHYEDLVMWKVQFLDRYHLLVKFGSTDGVVHRSADMSSQNAFLAVYNLETTEMLGFYQNTSEELLSFFENFCDHFRAVPRFPLYMNFISSYSNNIHVREQLRKQRVACSSSKSGSYAQVVRRTLGWLPFNSQCHSPSVYFDQSLFHYDEKLISAVERHKPCMEHPVKFISRRKPNSLKFKINPGSEEGSHDGRSKRVASFVFHPIFPFAISIQQSYMQPSITNFHFRK